MGIWNSLFGKPTLASLGGDLSRDRLVQSGRIAFIDDERPLLIEELRQSGFSVDHDTTGDNLQNYDNQIYDVAIVDFAGVGHRLGSGQGLEVVKHLRRVSPRTRIIAYTSKSLTSSESDFFRLSHTVLQKDLGIGDSLALIEGELQKALSKEYLFEALITKLKITSGEERQRMQDALIKALAKRDEGKFRRYLKEGAGLVAEKGVDILLSKLFVSTN